MRLLGLGMLAIAAGCDCGSISHRFDASGEDGGGGGLPDRPPTIHPPPVPDAGLCASAEGTIRVSTRQLGDRACDASEIAGILYEVEPASDGTAVHFRVDLCPGADADCRCEITLDGVGEADYFWRGIEEGPFHASLSERHLLLYATQNGGEVGPYEDVLTLYAQEGYLDAPAYPLAGLAISSSSRCSAPLGEDGFTGHPCTARQYDGRIVIDASIAGWEEWTEGGEAVLREGETASVPGTFATAKLIRSHERYCVPAGDPPPPLPPAAFLITWSFPAAP